MQKGFRRFCVTLAIILGIYFTWANAGRQRLAQNTQLRIDSTYTIGEDRGTGNIVGISPYMLPEDYASKDHFFNKLDGYMQIALQKGWLRNNSVVLFPEYTARWLVIESEKQSIYSAATTANAMTTLVSSNFFSYMRSWFTAPDGIEDKIRYSVFSSKGNSVAKTYVDVFSALAKKYQVTITGASVLLPNPRINRNRILVNKGPLFNISAVFRPDGTMESELIVKKFPSGGDEFFTEGDPQREIPVFRLPIGNTAILLGTDSWYEASYTSLNGREINNILNPAHISPSHSIQEYWSGFQGKLVPADILPADSGKISVEDAWIRYGLAGKASKTGAANGLMVALKGRFWDNICEGEYIAVTQDTVHRGNYVSGGSLVCQWINQP